MSSYETASGLLQAATDASITSFSFNNFYVR